MSANSEGQSVWTTSSRKADINFAQVSAADLANPSGTIAAADAAVQADVALPVAEGEEAAPITPAPAAATAAEIPSTPRRFHYAARLTVRTIFDDNINISHSHRVSDFITTIEPGILLGFGDSLGHQDNYLLFNYAPSLFLYADHTEADAFQQLVHLEGQWSLSRLTLKLSQDVQILDSSNLDLANGTETINDRVNLDAAQRTRVDIYTTRLDASYYLAGKTFLSAGLGASIYDYSSLNSSSSFSGNAYLNYIYSPKLTVGAGGGFGYTVSDAPNPNQTSESISARVSYQATGKLTFSGTGGIEFRQFEGNGRGTYTTPIFDLNATYQPFDGTNVAITASRRTMNSAVLGGEDFSSTDLTISVRQRFLRRFNLGLNFGYENAEYFSTVGGTGSGRSDNYLFVQPSVDMNVTRFWTVGAYYLHRVNNSSPDSFSFYDNQVGLRTSLIF